MTNERDAQEEKRSAESALNAAFSPHAPIDAASLFRGRVEQIRDVADAMRAAGLHAVIYGDRGVGKTSLANIVDEFVGARSPSPRPSADRTIRSPRSFGGRRARSS